MALFNIIAKKEKIEWEIIHAEIFSLEYEFISVFPITTTLGLDSPALGITTQGNIENNLINKVKTELSFILEVLHRNDFLIYELYDGQRVTPDDYLEIMTYL